MLGMSRRGNAEDVRGSVVPLPRFKFWACGESGVLL